jgi:CRP-like cAMP-binding protein
MQVLTALLAHMHLRVYAAGDWLFDRARGDGCDALTLLVAGRVRLAHDVVPVAAASDSSPPEPRRIVSTLRAGQFFGETAPLRWVRGGGGSDGVEEEEEEEEEEDCVAAALHCGMATAPGTITAVVTKHTLRLLGAKSPALLHALYATVRHNLAVYERCVSGAVLKPLPFTAGLPAVALKQLGALLDISAHPADMLLLRNVPGGGEGDRIESDTLLVVVRGSLRLTLRDPQGLVLAQDVGVGAVVNHEALLSPSLRARGSTLLAVRCLTTVVVAAISVSVASAITRAHRSPSAVKSVEGMGVVLQQVSWVGTVGVWLGFCDHSTSPRQGLPRVRL